MKRALLVVLLIVAATPVFAEWWPSFSPTKVRVAVGETVTVVETARWSGITSYSPIDWAFITADRDIADAYAEVINPSAVEIPITGIAPGVTNLARRINGRPGYAYVDITVYCGSEPPALAAEPVVDVKLGEEVTLRAVSPIADRSKFLWYAGELGDTSRLIPFGAPELTFTPESAGTHHYWVMAMTPCSTSTVAFQVNVHRSKRRAVQ